MTKCTEALRLLERLTTDEAMHYPVDHGNPGYPGDEGVKVSGQLHCDYCDANVDSDGPHKDDCPWAEARVFLATTPTCDAEKAVLVEALVDLLSVCDRFASWHPADSTVQVSAATAQARAALANTSPSALLARGERLRRFTQAVEQHDWLALIDIAGLANAGEDGLLVSYEVEGDYVNDARYVWPKRMRLLIEAARAALAESPSGD